VSTKKPLRAKLATSVSLGAAALSRVTGRGDGSVIGGRLGLMIDPNLLANLAAGRQIALVSGTNGKTTTTRLTAAAMGVLGDVATNSLGANMPTGHTSALARAGSTEYAVLEVDEHYLPEVLTSTQPKVVALLNLSRDQLDRAKEVAMMADLWRRTLAQHPVHVVANADDPMITWAAGGATAAGAGVTWVAAGQRWHDDSWVCPECGSHIERAVAGDGPGPSDGSGDVPVAPESEATPAPLIATAEPLVPPRSPGGAMATAPATTSSTVADPPATPAGVEVVDEVTVAAGGALDGATELITAVPGSANGGYPGHLTRANAVDRAGSVDERTMLMPTVPVPEAAHPAGRPLGSVASHPATPVLAPIATPQTVADTVPGLPIIPSVNPTATPPTPNPATPAPAMSTNGTATTGTATTDAATPAVDVRSSVPTEPTATAADGADWWCTGCALRRPTPQWRVEGDTVIDPTGRAHAIHLQLPGRVNRANAATALAVAAEFGVDPGLAAPRLAQVVSIAGRYAQVQRDGRDVRLLLAKNPAGWLEAFDMAEDVPTLLSINSRDPDGLDTSWLFDVDFSPLQGRRVLITGERAYDLAVRLDINDIPFSHVESFGEALRSVPAGRVEVIANYTAFQDIRAELDRVN
jgi:UDP-N-acetylmuramyl tripeptide synthase